MTTIVKFLATFLYFMRTNTDLTWRCMQYSLLARRGFWHMQTDPRHVHSLVLR